MLSSLNLAPDVSIIIGVIVALFVLSVILLITVSMRYRGLHNDISIRGGARSSFAVALKNEYSSAYRQYGKDTNTPAIIGNTISTTLSKELFSERFINAVTRDTAFISAEDSSIPVAVIATTRSWRSH